MVKQERKAMGQEQREEHLATVKYLAEQMEAEAAFDPYEWEEGDPIPEGIADHMYHRDDSRPCGTVDCVIDAHDRWREDYMSNVLDIRATVGIPDGNVSDVTVVLGTGGPHIEITLHDDERATLRMYGWWRSDEVEWELSIPGHPIMSAWEYCEMVEGLSL